MAAIENLEIIVDVDIGSALAALEDLQEELMDLAESIEAVDAVGTEGIDIRTNLDDADAELAALKTKLEAFEAANELNIDTDFDRGRYTIPNFQQSGNMADNIGDLFGFMDFPGGGDGGRGGLFKSLRRQVDELTNSFEGFKLRMSDMHNVLAQIVPILLVFIGVIPAAITALVGLAAAAVAAAASLAAMAGLGALGVGLVDGQFDMKRLSNVWKDVKNSFIEAFAPLAEELQPLFMNAVDGLGEFFQAVANQGDALMALTDEARAFGGFLMDFIPDALRTLVALVEALSPLFASFGNWLNENFNNIVRDLASVTMQAAPAIAELIAKLGQAVPWIVEMSIGFTQVANAVLDVMGIIGTLMDFLGIGGRRFGLVTAAALAFATALALANSQLVAFALKGIASAVLGLYQFFVGLLAADSALTYMAGTTIVSAISSLIAFVGGLNLSAGALYSFAASAFTATGAAAALLTVLTLGGAAVLVGVALSASSAFLGLAGNIDSATQSLKEFDKVSNGTNDFGGPGDNPYGFDPENPRTSAGGGGGVAVFNVESSGDGQEDRSNLEYADWLSGRSSGG